MKKWIFTLASLSVVFSMLTAGVPAGSTSAPVIASQKGKWLFKPLAANEVSFEMERIGDEVMMYLYSKSLRSIDAVVIEKSQNGSMFVPCKTVKVAEHLNNSKNYIGISDEKPFTANLDCFYRIKVVAKDGTSKVYEPQVLSGIQYIEPVEYVENQR
ncbi:MAG: hypothetical protein U0T84_05500 [Chitinophagales bacterium]